MQERLYVQRTENGLEEIRGKPGRLSPFPMVLLVACGILGILSACGGSDVHSGGPEGAPVDPGAEPPPLAPKAEPPPAPNPEPTPTEVAPSPARSSVSINGIESYLSEPVGSAIFSMWRVGADHAWAMHDYGWGPESPRGWRSIKPLRRSDEGFILGLDDDFDDRPIRRVLGSADALFFSFRVVPGGPFLVECCEADFRGGPSRFDVRWLDPISLDTRATFGMEWDDPGSAEDESHSWSPQLTPDGEYFLALRRGSIERLRIDHSNFTIALEDRLDAGVDRLSEEGCWSGSPLISADSLDAYSVFYDCPDGLRLAHFRLGTEPGLQATYPVEGPLKRSFGGRKLFGDPQGRFLFLAHETVHGNHISLTAYERNPDDGSLSEVQQLDQTFDLGRSESEIDPALILFWAGADENGHLYTVSVWPDPQGSTLEMIVARFERDEAEWRLREWLTAEPLHAAFDGVALLPDSLRNFPPTLPFLGARIGPGGELLHLLLNGERDWQDSEGTSHEIRSTFVLNLRFPPT